MSVVRPGLGGQAAAAHCGSPVLEVERRGQRLHQQSSPALGELEVETVRALLSCNQELSWPSLGLITDLKKLPPPQRIRPLLDL